MTNKNILFIIVSFILGFIISIFYNKSFNKNFIFYFITISIIFYVIFYYLGGNNTYENFDDYGYILNDLSSILDKLEKYSNEEEEQTSNIVQEEQHEKKQENPPNNNNLSLVPSEENSASTTPTPDITKYLSEKYLPFNINISYNAQNSTNNLNNNDNIPNKHNNNTNTNTKNLGPIGNCDSSRIYNNSDWIYGSNAWTNNPDYYIPNKINEISLSKLKNNNNNTVCPLEINKPWSEYKSGDSDPEPFNL
jgi:hypothetical protein